LNDRDGEEIFYKSIFGVFYRNYQLIVT
jgi:hypothetical protein